MNASKLLDEEYTYFFENKDHANVGYESNNPLYSIYINNNLPSESGLLFGST